MAHLQRVRTAAQISSEPQTQSVLLRPPQQVWDMAGGAAGGTRLRVGDNAAHCDAVAGYAHGGDRVVEQQHRDGGRYHAFCVPQHLRDRPPPGLSTARVWTGLALGV